MLSRILNINFRVLLLSFVMASTLWYVVVIDETVDVQLDVQVEYKNIPKDLIVTEGLLHNIKVRLRGPEALLRDLPVSSRVHVIDLSNIRKGKNIIPFPNLQNKNLRAFDIHDITPSRVVIVADTLQERNVKIQPNIAASGTTSNIAIEDLSITPSNVLIRGPNETIKHIDSIPLQIRINPNSNPGPHSHKEILYIPQSYVTATPTHVTVSYTVLSERKTLNLERKVRIGSNTPQNYSIEPDIIDVQVEVPELLANNSSFLHGMVLSITPPLMDIESSAMVPLHIVLPEGMTLINELPKFIKVKRLK